jgi:hypothetical protein
MNYLLKIKYQIVLSWISLILLGLSTTNAVPEVRDNEIKAMFLFYFSKFIEYPESALSSKSQPLRICIFGEDPFQNALDAAVQGKDAHGHSIEIKRFNKTETIKECQILFISSAEQASLPQIFAHTRQYPILTVSDMDNFIKSGGMIQFYIEENKVRFMVDLKKIQGATLKVSSRLLQVAKVVND